MCGLGVFIALFCIINLHQKAQFYQGRGDDADILSFATAGRIFAELWSGDGGLVNPTPGITGIRGRFMCVIEITPARGAIAYILCRIAEI